MVPCLIAFSPAQELRAGLAAALLVSLNLGKDLIGKDACFQSLKIYYIYYVAKEEGIAFRLLFFTAVLWAKFSPLYSSCIEVWKLLSLCGIYSLQMPKHFVHPSVILVLQIVLLPLYLLEMQCNVIEVVFFGGYHVWFVLTNYLTQLKSWAGITYLPGICEKDETSLKRYV